VFGWPDPNTGFDQSEHALYTCYFIINKYKTFSVLIYSYINTSGNWENEKLFIYNIAQRNIKKEIFRRFRVDIELYQHGS
jgi:hypothetical protein